MLKKESILENPILKDLSEAQIAELEKVSENAEQTIIDQNRSKFWKAIDEDVKEVFGVEKMAGIKTYQHFKDVLSEVKKESDNVGQLKGKIAEYETSINSLNEKLKNGSSDLALKGKVESLEAEKERLTKEIESIKGTYLEKDEQFKRLQEERNNDKVMFTLESKFGEVLREKEIEFLPNLPKGVLDREIDAAKSRVLKKGKASMKEDGTFVFYDENGVELKNPKKGLDLYTPKDLFFDELMSSGIVAKKREVGGAGGKGGSGKGDNKRIDLNGVTTQVEAVSIIEKMVLENGTPKTSPQFMKEVREIVKANKVLELPMQ